MRLTNLRDLGTDCPSQWSGDFEGGKKLYGRYRWGHLTIDVGEETIYAVQVGGEYDGCMGTEEFKTHLRKAGIHIIAESGK